MSAVAALGVIAFGTVLVAMGLRTSRPRGDAQVVLAELALPPGGPSIELGPASRAYGPVTSGTLRMANRAIERTRSTDSLRILLERADLAIRPSELVVIAGSAGIAIGGALVAATGNVWLLPAGIALAAPATAVVLERLAHRRTKKVVAELPDALMMISSSLRAGHTVLRAMQMLASEQNGPLAVELQRVVAETQLGAPLVDSLERMSNRLQDRDVEWMVQAIRIQQQVGGKLTDLLITIAEVLRGRDELRREVRVLTAEGRMSAWVLGGLPVALVAAVSIINPGYLDPLLRGWGIAVLVATGVSVAFGVGLILRMVKGVER